MTPELESKARDMGWRSQEEFRGDPALWVDADEYVRRGEEILPLVKAENRRLTEKTDKLSGEIARLTSALAEQRTSMDELAAFNTEQLKERLAEQKRQLKAELREAKRGDDDARVEEIEDRIEANDEARAKVKEPVAAPPPSAPETVAETPEYRAWAEANPWYGGTSRLDIAKTAAAQRFGLEAASAGKKGAAFFAAVNEAMAEVYPPPKRVDPSEDGRPTGGSREAASGSGFASLPPEAKAKAKEQASRFVGPNKMFKDEKAWFSYYAEQYNVEAA